MSTIFYTADTHFCHKGMITHCWRPELGDSVEEMNETLIDNWNSVVTKRDIVYHLGDVGVGSDHEILECVARLRGTKHLITGNHDSVHPVSKRYGSHVRRWLQPGLFESVAQFASRDIGKTPVVLSHFPYVGDHTLEERFDQFRLRDKGVVLLHGHVHDAWDVREHQINVGVDMWKWRPLSIDEVAEIMDNYDLTRLS